MYLTVLNATFPILGYMLTNWDIILLILQIDTYNIQLCNWDNINAFSSKYDYIVEYSSFVT